MNWWHPLYRAIRTWNCNSWGFFLNVTTTCLLQNWQLNTHGNTDWDTKTVLTQFQYSMVFIQVGFFSALVHIWQREQRLVGFIAMAQSAKIQPGCIPALWGFVKTTPCQHEHMHVSHTLYILIATNFIETRKNHGKIRNGCLLETSTYVVAAQNTLGRFCSFYNKMTPSGVNTMFAWGADPLKLLATGKRQIAWGARLWKLHSLMVFENVRAHLKISLQELTKERQSRRERTQWCPGRARTRWLSGCSSHLLCASAGSKPSLCLQSRT